MNKRNFFKQLRQCLGKADSGSERFIQELKDHLEDQGLENKVSTKISSDQAKLGHPAELAKLYKKAIFSKKLRLYLGVFIFGFVLLCSEAMALFFDKNSILVIEILSLIGLFLYMFALPVVFLTMLMAGVSTWLWGENIVVFWPIRLVLLPLLVAGFYTFFYLVFCCDEAIWAFRKPKREAEEFIIS